LPGILNFFVELQPDKPMAATQIATTVNPAIREQLVRMAEASFLDKVRERQPHR
jgi:hypothetical protein